MRKTFIYEQLHQCRSPNPLDYMHSGPCVPGLIVIKPGSQDRLLFSVNYELLLSLK